MPRNYRNRAIGIDHNRASPNNLRTIQFVAIAGLGLVSWILIICGGISFISDRTSITGEAGAFRVEDSVPRKKGFELDNYDPMSQSRHDVHNEGDEPGETPWKFSIVNEMIRNNVQGSKNPNAATYGLPFNSAVERLNPPVGECGVEQPKLVPLPSKYQHGTTTVQVSSDLKFVIQGKSAILENAFVRYVPILFPHNRDGYSTRVGSNAVKKLRVIVTDLSERHPQLDTDESYTLDISSKGAAVLTANGVYGALRGLETFSQLVQFDFKTQTYYISGAPWLIDDKPRFPHRGLMIDTARHFVPLPFIRRIIDSMVYAKLNVLHWHMSENESFAMQSFSYPKLWDAAFSEGERYLQTEIADIVEYARQRGVRVIVEFDMPGHAGSWCVGYPQVCPSKTCRQPLNPANPETFQLVEGLLKEVTGGGKNRSGLFPDDFIHLGGDEVNTTCWDSEPALKQWRESNGFTLEKTYEYFLKKADEIAFAQNRRPIHWVEVFDHFGTNLDKRTVIHVWKSKLTLSKVVSAGYQAILSDNSNWYLDYVATNWEMMYLNEPLEGINDVTAQNLVLGGQVEMWGETVDGSDLEATVWPRTAAFAERMWSPREVSSTVCALPRMQWFRCLLLRRGIAAAPVLNKLARQAPPHYPGHCEL